MTAESKPIDIKALPSNDYAIVLDTSVLLSIYEYSPDFAEFALACLSSASDTIWLPSTVVREFDKKHRGALKRRERLIENLEHNRLEKLREQRRKAIQSIEELEKLNYPDTNEVREQFAEGFDALEKVLSNYFSRHDALNIIKDTWTDDPPAALMERIRNGGHVLPELTIDQLYDYAAEGKRRFEKHTPPGHADKKKGGLTQYNDLVIWKEIIKFANEKRKNIVFVTGDAKQDWWRHGGENTEFHPALVDEFRQATTLQTEGGAESLNIIALAPNAFYSAASSSFGIPRNDMVDLALEITEDAYIDSIRDDAFCEIEDELIYSDDLYLDSLVHPLGTEGVPDWEMCDCSLKKYEPFDRDEGTATYKLIYRVRMMGESHDYWGRDDDTKEPILSPGYEHEIEGDVEVLVQREIGEFTDFESDFFFERASLFGASFAETGYTDYNQDDDYDGCSYYDEYQFALTKRPI